MIAIKIPDNTKSVILRAMSTLRISCLTPNGNISIDTDIDVVKAYKDNITYNDEQITDLYDEDYKIIGKVVLLKEIYG